MLTSGIDRGKGNLQIRQNKMDSTSCEVTAPVRKRNKMKVRNIKLDDLRLIWGRFLSW